MKFTLNCEEANHFCDKNQYRDATFWEKVKLNVHLIYCAVCRKYTANNMRLTRLFNKSNLQSFPQAQKEILRERMRREMME